MYSDISHSRPSSSEPNRSGSVGTPSSDDQGGSGKTAAKLGGRPLKKTGSKEVVSRQDGREQSSVNSDQSSLADSYKIDATFVLPWSLRPDTPEATVHTYIEKTHETEAPRKSESIEIKQTTPEPSQEAEPSPLAESESIQDSSVHPSDIEEVEMAEVLHHSDSEKASEPEAPQLSESKAVFLAPPEKIACEDDACFVYLTFTDKPVQHSDYEALIKEASEISDQESETPLVEPESPLAHATSPSVQEDPADEPALLLPTREKESTPAPSSEHSARYSPAEDLSDQPPEPEIRVSSSESVSEAPALTAATEASIPFATDVVHKAEPPKCSLEDMMTFKRRSPQEWQEVTDQLVIEKSCSLKALGQEQINPRQPEHQHYLKILCRFISPRTCAVILACLGGKTTGPLTTDTDKANALQKCLEARNINNNPILFRELFATVLKALWASYESEREYPKLRLALSNMAHAFHNKEETNPASEKLSRLRAQKRSSRRHF